MWQVAIGGLIAALSGWGTQLLVARTGRGQWLAEQRLGAYSTFYDRWEDCWGAIKAGSPTDEVKTAVTELQIAARAIDLLGDSRTRNAAWNAVGALDGYRQDELKHDAVQKQINISLNDFKRHIGVQRQFRY